MAAVMIVEMQPAGKRGGAGRLAAVDADVGPLLEEGAVEAFDLAVGMRPVGAGAAMADAGGQAGASEVGAAVARTVVGEHDPDADAALGEPAARALPERDRGDRALVGQNLAVGDTGVVVDGGVDVGVTDAAAPLCYQKMSSARMSRGETLVLVMQPAQDRPTHDLALAAGR